MGNYILTQIHVHELEDKYELVLIVYNVVKANDICVLQFL